VRAQPREQLTVTIGGGGELPVTQQVTVVVDRHRVMGVLMGVHAANDGTLILCHAVSAFR
jgi:hypothetical protein